MSRRIKLLFPLAVAAALHCATSCVDLSSIGGKIGSNAESPRYFAPEGDSAYDAVAVPDAMLVPDGTDLPGLPDLDLSSVEGLALFSIEPASGAALGGEIVMLVGAGFKDGMDVFFGESLAINVFIVNDNYCTVETPVHPPGVVDVSAANDGGKSVLPSAFEFVAEVTLDSVEPAHGDASGGTPLLVEGSGFEAGCMLFVGTRQATQVAVASNTAMQAVTPPGTCGVADVRVQCPGGAAVLTDAFSYHGLPNVFSLDPHAGPIVGGFWVTLSGSGFTPLTTVAIGGAQPEAIELLSHAEMRVKFPPGLEGPASVLVENECGPVVLDAAFLYVEPGVTPLGPPKIVGVVPQLITACEGGAITVGLDSMGAPDQLLLFIDNEPTQIVGMDEDLGTVDAVVPPLAPGAADVLAVTSEGNALLPAGLLIQESISVASVSPAIGPPAGGTQVEIDGCGFQGAPEVLFGKTLAAAIVAVSDTKIQAIAPPGSPGPVDVTVASTPGVDTLPSGFNYMDGAPQLFFLDPDYGSRAGGTFVRFVGSGVPADATLYIGEKKCFDLQYVDSSLVTARTPPNAIGTYDASIVWPGGSVVLPAAYTYFNPRSSSGGTWGGPIDESVNVTVVDSSNGKGLVGAFVMLGTDSSSPHKGFTDEKGQITFSTPGLKGKQTVTAAKAGYSLYSVVHYDAQNVTVFLNQIVFGSGSGSPYVPPKSYISGHVIGLDKYVVIPPGSCAGKTSPETEICKPCKEDSDCTLPTPDDADPTEPPPDAAHCAVLGDHGKFCAPACLSPGDCPEGFVCGKVSLEHSGCIPAAGKKMAKCMASKKSLFGMSPDPGPGGTVNEHQIYFINAGVGEVAVVCYGGYEDPDTMLFTPTVMGLKRHIPMLNGQVKKDQDVVLSIPLGARGRIGFHDLPYYPAGIRQPYLLASIELGKDGYLSLPREPVFVHDGWYFKLEPLPSSMTGQLEAATYSLYGSIQSETVYSLPYAVRMVTDVPDLSGDGMIVVTDWGEKTAVFPPIKGDVVGLSYGGPNDYVVATNEGEILRWDGFGWTAVGVPALDEGFTTLRSDDAGGMWLGGDGGTIWHFDGVGWTEISPVVFQPVRGIHPMDGGAVVVYPAVLAMLTGDVATQVIPGPGGYQLKSVWASDFNDVWTLTDPPAAWNHGAAGWTLVAEYPDQELNAIDGTGPDDVWIAGDGLLARHDGNDLTPYPLDLGVNLRAITARSPGNVLAAGDDGVLLSAAGGEVTAIQTGTVEDFRCIDYSVDAGSVAAAGIQAYNLGPYVSFPHILKPQEGSTFDYTSLDWEMWTQGAEADNHYLILSNQEGYPFWVLVVDGEVTSVPLPPIVQELGANVFPDGDKRLNMTSSLDPSFNIDYFTNGDFSIFDRISWSVDLVSFK